MRLKPQSLKRRFLLYLFLTAVIVFFLTELIFIEKNRRSLMKMLDKTVEACVLSLAASAPAEPDGRIRSYSFDEIMRDFGGHHTRVHFLILRIRDQSEIERSESLKNVNFSLPKPLREFSLDKAYFWNARINGRRVRFVALREAVTIETEKEENETVDSDEQRPQMSNDGGRSLDTGENEYLYIVGLGQRYIRKRLQGTLETTAPVLGIGLALMLLLGWIVINRGFEPLHDLEREVESISSSNMAPVTVPEDKELASVATTLNTMIGILKESFERERRFTANVAHELRTRISEMRSISEVALRLDDNLDEHNRKNYEDILASAEEMQRTVINLLTLARCHSGQLKTKKDIVKLQPLMSQIWNEQADKASARGITVCCDVPADLVIITDRDLFETILKNLFSNAVSYTTVQGKIEWGASIQGDEFSFSVSNSIEDLSEDDLLSMFEPFWQMDKTRTSGDHHSGLGLSLVQSLAQVLGLSVNAHLTTPTFLTITLSGKTNRPA